MAFLTEPSANWFKNHPGDQVSFGKVHSYFSEGKHADFFILSLFFMLAVSFGSSIAGELREIDLFEGSTIIGEVQSLSNGIYTIKSESLGIIQIEASKIRAIHPVSPSLGAESGNGSPAGELKSFQEKMLSDKEIMSLIQTLQNDPEFNKVLQDPEIMKAVNSGDIAALQANPRFMMLLNNAAVKEIVRKVK